MKLVWTQSYWESVWIYYSVCLLPQCVMMWTHCFLLFSLPHCVLLLSFTGKWNITFNSNKIVTKYFFFFPFLFLCRNHDKRSDIKVGVAYYSLVFLPHISLQWQPKRTWRTSNGPVSSTPWERPWRDVPSLRSWKWWRGMSPPMRPKR